MGQKTHVPVRLTALVAFSAFAALAAATVAATPGQVVGQARGPEALGFKKHFFVDITNPSPLTLENHAIVIDVDDIRASVAADFNTYFYAFFDVKGGEYALAVTQADDFDKDRYHDEIVLVRTLPAASTSRLVCYYTPERSFQLMATPKAFARSAWEAGGAGAGWESNLIAFEFVRGRIGFYGKLQSGLILKRFPVQEARSQDWGMDVLGPGDSAGLGGLSLWDGAVRIPLFGPAAPEAKLTVIAPGPVRALVKAEYPAVRTAAGEIGITAFLSTFADSAFSRQEVVISSKSPVNAVVGPGIQKLAGETWSFDKAKGYLATWGRGAQRAGEVGMAAIFPPADLAGLDDSASDRAVRLNGRSGSKITFWVAGAWERGVTTPGVPATKNWTRRIEEMAGRLLVPVKVEFKAK